MVPMVTNPLSLSFSKVYFWLGWVGEGREGGIAGQLCSCLDKVKVGDSWGTFRHYWWMREHRVHPKLILHYTDNSFPMTGLFIKKKERKKIWGFTTPLTSFFFILSIKPLQMTN